METTALLGLTTGEMIAALTNGANLVDGKQCWEHIDDGKNDLDLMLDCCRAQLRIHETMGAAPYYFDRAAMLLAKAGLHEHCVAICELYINLPGHAENPCFEKMPRVVSMRKRIARAQAKLIKEGKALAAAT